MTVDKNHKYHFFNIRPEILVCLFLVIATLAVYWQVKNFEFVNLDDHSYILKNQYVQAGLTFEGINWAFSFPGFDYWHPLTWLSHMLDSHLYGLKPGMHHLISLILHVINSMLLFMVFKRMTGAVWKSAFVAAMFALHPLNVESVVWLAERKNVLSTLFWMLTMLTYFYYSNRPNIYRYLPIFFVFALGLMAKPMLATLPFVLLLLDYWPLGRYKIVQSDGNQKNPKSIESGFQWPLILRLVLEKIPLLALSVVSIFLSSLAVRRLGIVVSTALFPTKLRIYNALVSYVSYIKKMVWPHNLAVYYPYPQSLPLWQVAGAILLLACISIIVFRLVKQKPYLAVGWLWYIGTLVPAIGLVQAGLWPAIADRFVYVPLIGLFIVIAWGVPDLVARWRFREIKLATLSAALISILMATTYLQAGYWSDSITLFEHALDVTDNNYVAHHKLGEALEAEGKTDAAIIHYSETLRIRPDFVSTYLNLGVALREQGKFNKAIDQFSKVLRLKPDYAVAHKELGITLEEQGDFAEAIRHYLKALEIRPDYAKVHNKLGIILARQGKIEDAIFHYRKALQFSPNMTQALYNLSWVNATHENEEIRNGQEAVRLAERFCKISQYSHPLALDALAAAYAESGRFDAAVSTSRKGLKLALQQGNKELALGLKKRLELYKAGSPYRQQTHEKN